MWRAGVIRNLFKMFSKAMGILRLLWLNMARPFRTISNIMTVKGPMPRAMTVRIFMKFDRTISMGWNLRPEVVSSSAFQGKDIKTSVINSILFKGKAILLSSLILCIGFGVMVFSSFVPTINFGALSSIIMITAVIGDILILPSVALLLSGMGVKFYKHKEITNGI